MAAHCSGGVGVCVCVFTAVCVHLDVLNAGQKFRVGVATRHVTHSLYLSLIIRFYYFLILFINSFLIICLGRQFTCLENNGEMFISHQSPNVL